MGVKLNKETSDVINVSQMKNQQVGEIILNNDIRCVGCIVIRKGNDLLSISDESRWSFLFSDETGKIGESFKVRILKNGETLTITDNE